MNKSILLNCDSSPLKNWEMTPEGYMKLWISIATANHDMVYLNADGTSRTEYITKEDLFNKESINSLIGKPLTLNHPPVAVTGLNYNKYAIGNFLQEFVEDADNLVMSGIVYDPEIIKGIIDGSYKYTSAGYSAVKKPLNTDGKIQQLIRSYNHGSFLTPDNEPRAGKTSRILTFNMPNKDSSPKTETNQNSFISDNLPKIDDSVQGDADKSLVTKVLNVGELIQLHSEFDPVLKSAGKTIDFNMDSVPLKRQILGCYYPESAIVNLSDNQLDGFWTGFYLNKELIIDSRKKDDNETLSSESTDSRESNREKFIRELEGR